MPGTPTEPHFRLSLLADLPDGEIASCNLSLRPDNNDWLDAATSVAKKGIVRALLDGPSGVDWSDVRDDCTAFWGRLNTGIFGPVHLRRVKIAAIDEEGHYFAAPIEFAVDQPGGVPADPISMLPHQVARKVTFITEGDLGRVKGGFYLPGVPLYNFDWTTNLTTAAWSGSIQGSVAEFVGALNNAPGLDTGAVKVVVASGIRHNADGSVRSQPALYDVTSVSVGRRVDVQRRRANKLSEARIARSSIE